MTTVPMLVGRFKNLLATVPLVWVRGQSRAANRVAEYRGLEELSSALLNVNDIWRDLRLREPRKQTIIDSFFN